MNFMQFPLFVERFYQDRTLLKNMRRDFNRFETIQEEERQIKLSVIPREQEGWKQSGATFRLPLFLSARR
jgi:hypothetical protein